MKMRALFEEEGAVSKLWNSPYVGIPLWLIPVLFAWRWNKCLPIPGKAIGGLAVVAGVTSVRRMKVLGQTSWVAILIWMAIIEFRAIDNDRRINDAKQTAFFSEQRTGFGTIAQQAQDNFSATAGKLQTSIDSSNAILTTTRQVAQVTKDNLTEYKGGNSFNYLWPDLSGGSTPQWNIHNAGDHILTGVVVKIDPLDGDFSMPLPPSVGFL